MKILIVINDYLNKSNGMCISTQRFVSEFKKKGHEVRVITNNRYGEMDYPLDVLKIPVFSTIIEKEGYTFAKVERQVIREAVVWADVVHLEDPFPVCRRAALEARKMNKPVTGTFHLYPENMTYAIHMKYAKFVNREFMRSFLISVYDRCDYVSCPTEIVKKRLQRYHAKGKMVTISNGIPEEFLGQERKRQFDGTLRILSVGRFAVEKNQKLLIHAVAKCKHKDKIRVVLAGKGPLEQALCATAQKHGVDIQMGFMKQKHLKEEMLCSDLYVHCANVEVEGMSCMEAFACGCVPIISDAKLSSTKAFALHGENLFRDGDWRSLSKMIDFFYENPDVLKAYSEEYMEYAKTMSVAGCAEKMLKMMEHAIKGKVSDKKGM